MKKVKLGDPTDRLLVFIIILLIGLLTTVLWYYGERINLLSAQNNINLSQRDAISGDLKFLIQEANQSLYNQRSATDAVQMKVYIPELKIYLPMNELSRSLVYRHSDAFSGSPEQLTVSAYQNIFNVPNDWGDVPCYQRHVDVTVNAKNSSIATGGENYADSVKLADGRTLYLYKQDNNKCTDVRWTINTPTQIIDLLKQAKSY